MEPLPIDSEPPHDGTKERGYSVELLEVDRFPGDLWILSQVGFALLAEIVHGRVDVLQPAARGVFDNLGPRLLGLAQRPRIGMANAAVAAKGFIGKLCDMGSAHHYRDSGGAKSVGCSVSSSANAGPGADSSPVARPV